MINPIQDLDYLIEALIKQSLTFFFFKFNQRTVEHGVHSQQLDQTDDKSTTTVSPTNSCYFVRLADNMNKG